MRTRETETEFQPVTAWQCAALKNSGAITFGDCEKHSRFRDIPRRAANREHKRAAERRKRVLYGFED